MPALTVTISSAARLPDVNECPAPTRDLLRFATRNPEASPPEYLLLQKDIWCMRAWERRYDIVILAVDPGFAGLSEKILRS